MAKRNGNGAVMERTPPAVAETPSVAPRGSTVVKVSPPNFRTAFIKIRGNAPYVQNRKAPEVMIAIKGAQEAGSTGRKGKKREATDFQANYQRSMHEMADGSRGINAAAFRNAMIDACRAVDFHMTKGKMSLFILADGVSPKDGTPLVKFTKGEPHYFESLVRNQNSGGMSLCARAMWDPGWEVVVRVQFDADLFTLSDVINLMMRVGVQIGVGEGRPFSKDSAGCGWGTFDVIPMKN